MESAAMAARTDDGLARNHAGRERPLRIVDVIMSVNPSLGGPVEGVLKIDETMRRLGHAHHILSLDHPDDPWVAQCPAQVIPAGLGGPTLGPILKLIPWSRYRYSPHFAGWLRAHAQDYDAVIVNGLWNYAAFGSWRGLRRARTPYFVFTHGMLDPWFKTAYPHKHWAKQAFWTFSEGRLLNHANAVLFTAEDERLRARGAFQPYRLREKVLGYGTAEPPDGAEAQRRAFLNAFPALAHRPYLLFMGRLHPVKACDLLIEAFAGVAKRRPAVDLVVAGPDQIGWRMELEVLAHRKGISPRIHWTGMLRGAQKWGAFRGCRAFVLPSHLESFGVAAVEAMACGKPVLTTRKVNIWREIDEGGAGVVGEDTRQGIENILERFLSLPETEQAAMGDAARRLFLQKFEITRLTRELLALIRKEIGDRDDPQRARDAAA